MEKKIRLGIIGFGNMGTSHARNLVAGLCPDFDLVAIADINPERAVLGLAMASRNTLHDLEVAPDDFGDLRHAALYQLIINLDKRGEACDVTAMSTA